MSAPVVSREQTQAKLDKQAAGMLAYTPEQHYTVADLFERRCEQEPERAFIVWEDDTISYAQANAHSNRIANALITHGLKSGQVAALMMENTPNFLYAWMALAKIGVTAALINTETRGAALTHALDITASNSLLIGSECLDKLRTVTELPSAVPVYVFDNACDNHNSATRKSMSAPLVDLSAQLTQYSDKQPSPRMRDKLVGADTFSLIFTSGTTGLPKAAYITHMRWLGTGESWKRVLELDADTVFYCVLPLFHGAAGMSLFSTVLASGGSMVVRKRFSTSHFWPDVKRHNIQFAQYSGEMCRYLLNQASSPLERKHSLRVLTGAGLNAHNYAAFKERFGVQHIIEGYGGTELNIGMMNVDGVPGSCGRIPFKDRSIVRLVRYDMNKQCHVRDQEGFMVECGANEVGEVIGRILTEPQLSVGRFEGYTDRAATEAKILRDVFSKGDQWMSSGDLMRRDEEDYYYFVDRLGDTYRWKSENISTTEVSEALSAYPDMESINVYGVKIPEQEGRAGMVAIVMAKDSVFDGKAFYELARTNLAPYAIPIFVRLSKQEDRTATLKLRKTRLQEIGYAPDNSGDRLFVCDHAKQGYVPMGTETLKRLGIAPFVDTISANG